MTSTVARRFGVSLVLVALAAAGASARDDQDEAKTPLRRMQGAWTFTAPNGDPGTFTFDGETVKAEVHGETYVCKLTANSKAEPHPSIDFEITEGPGDAAGKTVLGIYKFDGAKKLTICAAVPDQARPTEFKAEADTLMLFELMKKE
jgi:uncharacterized protein (TIGR03067 family)